MLFKGTANYFDLRAFFWRLGHQPKLGVVAEWLNRQEGLATNHELAKIIWCRKCKALLLPHDDCSRNSTNDTRNTVTT